MKSINLLRISILSLAICFSANAQDKSSRLKRKSYGQNVGAFVNAPYFLQGFMAGLEYSLDPESTFILTYSEEIDEFSYFDGNTSIIGPGFFAGNNVDLDRVSISLEYRFYINPSRLGNDRAFLSPYLRYSSASSQADEVLGSNFNPETGTYESMLFQYTQTSLSFGFIVGRTWQRESGIHWDIWIGLGYPVIYNTSFSNDFNPGPNTLWNDLLIPFDARLGLALGYRFPI